MIIGIGLALAATLAYTGNSLLLTFLKDKSGPVLTKYLLLIALAANLCIHMAAYNRFYPAGLQGTQLLFLGVSGILGQVLGFIVMLKALQLIGPRLVLLVGTSITIFSFLLGWLFLDERQPATSFLYISLIISGIIITILNSGNRKIQPNSELPAAAAAGHGMRVTIESGSSKSGDSTPRGILLKGVLLALLLAACQAIGQLLSKTVILDGIPPLSVSTVRLSVSAGTLFLFTFFFKNPTGTTAGSFTKRDWLLIVMSAMMGPVLSIFLNLASLRFLNLGISAAVFQLSPVFMLFLTRIAFKEKIKPYALIGTLIAVSGTVLLTLG